MKSAFTILSVLLKLTSFSCLRIQLFICVIDMICIRVLVLEYDADMYQNSDDDDDDDDTYIQYENLYSLKFIPLDSVRRRHGRL